MRIATFPAGPWQANCYVIAAESGSQAVVIDPGMDAVAPLLEAVERLDVTPAAVVLTHGHIDHIWSVAPVCERYQIPAYIHRGDRPWLADPLAGTSPATAQSVRDALGGVIPSMVPADVHDLDEDIELAGLRIGVTHTPGHSPGCALLRVEGTLFAGDVLFAGSIGRTDLPGGDHETMLESLERHILTLPDHLEVAPGHGPATSIGIERATNPYLLDLVRLTL